MSVRANILGGSVAIFLMANVFLLPEAPGFQRRVLEPDDAGFRAAVTVADCTFSANPDKFLQATARHQKDLSETSITIGGKLGRVRYASPEPTVRQPMQRKNFIDDFVFDKMEVDDIPYAGPATDQELLRRTSLDLTGRIPSSDEVRQFLADTGSDKLDKKIDALLASPEFVDRWTMFYGDLLKNVVNASTEANPRYVEGRNAYYNYIKDFVAANKPYNLFVKELISATGDSFDNPANYFIVGGSTSMGPAQDTYDTLAVQTSTYFLGLSSFDCLLCHSGAGHLNALNVWGTQTTRMQAWKMAAFFARERQSRVTVSTTPATYKYTVTEAATGDYSLNTTSGNRVARQPEGTVKTVTPEYLFTGGKPGSGGYRAGLAEMLTADFQFARASVNYLWAEMMGMGIVDPPDQFDLARQNPASPPPAPWTVQPSNPALLDALAREFVRSNYDVRHIIGLIAHSSAYQLSSQFDGDWSETYTPYFARKYVRRLMAEQVHDAVIKATGLLPNYTINGVTAPVHWAMQIPDPNNEPSSDGNARNFLNFFLRGNRDTIARSSEGSILQALQLMNSPVVNNRIHNGNAGSLVNRLIAQKKNDNEVIEELFLSTLSRYPTAAEKALALKALATPSTRNAGIEDLQWTLINKVDFIYNY